MKRESEAKAYYIQREVMLAKRKEESSSDADFARLLTRPYLRIMMVDRGTSLLRTKASETN